MVGTKLGGQKAAKTTKRLHGEDFYRRIGAKGGAVKTPKGGFAANPALARIAGAKGGRRSRRTDKTYEEKWAKNYEEIEMWYLLKVPVTEISRRTGIPYPALRNRIKKESWA